MRVSSGPARKKKIKRILKRTKGMRAGRRRLLRSAKEALMSQPIIFDTDPGVDDAQAIAIALAHPEIELLGMTTTYGNVDIDTATRRRRSLGLAAIKWLAGGTIDQIWGNRVGENEIYPFGCVICIRS